MLLVVLLLSILVHAVQAKDCRLPNAGLLVLQNVSNPGISENGFVVPLYDNDCAFITPASAIKPNGIGIPFTAQVVQFIQPAFEDDMGNDLDAFSLEQLRDTLSSYAKQTLTDDIIFHLVVCTVVTTDGDTFVFGGLQNGNTLVFNKVTGIVSYQCCIDLANNNCATPIINPFRKTKRSNRLAAY
ncbi:hypothetical protein B0T19DRAFT_439843 [Cercophora scortea]|uniref:Uncharacterized protein n=1 Tax=Cercophora scortea TaxID=314031 RepID=A0AAE0IXH5_9PEZI|nr:hypothetical protein B0T19DRAFT_439843 [Cercophora scortea]